MLGIPRDADREAELDQHDYTPAEREAKLAVMIADDEAQAKQAAKFKALEDKLTAILKGSNDPLDAVEEIVLYKPREPEPPSSSPQPEPAANTTAKDVEDTKDTQLDAPGAQPKRALGRNWHRPPDPNTPDYVPRTAPHLRIAPYEDGSIPLLWPDATVNDHLKTIRNTQPPDMACALFPSLLRLPFKGSVAQMHEYEMLLVDMIEYVTPPREEGNMAIATWMAQYPPQYSATMQLIIRWMEVARHLHSLGVLDSRMRQDHWPVGFFELVILAVLKPVPLSKHTQVVKGKRRERSNVWSRFRIWRPTAPTAAELFAFFEEMELEITPSMYTVMLWHMNLFELVNRSNSHRYAPEEQALSRACHTLSLYLLDPKNLELHLGNTGNSDALIRYNDERLLRITAGLKVLDFHERAYGRGLAVSQQWVKSLDALREWGYKSLKNYTEPRPRHRGPTKPEMMHLFMVIRDILLRAPDDSIRVEKHMLCGYDMADPFEVLNLMKNPKANIIIDEDGPTKSKTANRAISAILVAANERRLLSDVYRLMEWVKETRTRIPASTMMTAFLHVNTREDLMRMFALAKVIKVAPEYMPPELLVGIQKQARAKLDLAYNTDLWDNNRRKQELDAAENAPAPAGDARDAPARKATVVRSRIEHKLHYMFHEWFPQLDML